MDRRSWPWKKKASEKLSTSVDTAASSLAISAENTEEQDISKNLNYAQISTTKYTQITELEGQVKTLTEKLSSLNEKLFSAQSELLTKDNLVKQHAKVAEEAVSGWEKAEAEALVLKNHLESVTLQKLGAEDRAAHLDGALKECMRQIHIVKEECEKKLQEITSTKNKQWEKLKADSDVKITNLEELLRKTSAENTALSRSLQERSNMLMKVTEEKSQADAEIEVLKAEIQSCEKQVSSLRYELHIISKELEIRNEEKNMSLRTAEVANRQHMDGLKKIAKLEAECQRLRGLVRKKLPGPAALAQMKFEVESFGREREPNLRRSPSKFSSTHSASVTEFSVDNIQQFHKEIDFLTTRLLTAEEETKMLKEALSKCNSELQASRNTCARTSSKLHGLEGRIQLINQSRSSLDSNLQSFQIPVGGSLTNTSNPPSMTSMSEDGVDDEGSCADSMATELISELSSKKESKVKNVKSHSDNRMQLLDDFLEMERLACLSTGSSGAISLSGKMNDDRFHCHDLVDITKEENINKIDSDLHASLSLISSNEEVSHMKHAIDKENGLLEKLRSVVASLFKSQAKDSDMHRSLEVLNQIMEDLKNYCLQPSPSCTTNETCPVGAASIPKPGVEYKETVNSGFSLFHESDSSVDVKCPFDVVSNAITVIHDYVLFLGKEATDVNDRSIDTHNLSQKIEVLSLSANKVLHNEISLADFLLSLSHVLAEASRLNLNMFSDKRTGGGSYNSDCIDKVTLSENIGIQRDVLKESFSNECNHVSFSASEPDILLEGKCGSSFDHKSTAFKFSLEELEQLKVERDTMAVDLAKCTECMEHYRKQLEESEQLLAEVKSELAASKKSNELTETQLKCMAESYKTLEMHAKELENEMSLLNTKAEALHAELQEEKHNLENALARCKDLEEHTERVENYAISADGGEIKRNIKEFEINAAAAKLAQCQETIVLLGKQLKALGPSANPMDSSSNEGQVKGEDFFESIQSASHQNPLGNYGLQQDLDQLVMENPAAIANGNGRETPLDALITTMNPSDNEVGMFMKSPINSKKSKHMSTSSKISPGPAAEKNAGSFSRFFSRRRAI